MELLQLRYFYESAVSGSFAKTAEKYMVPTTSVSASVKRLEKELGCKLFDRTANRITLNLKGKRLQQSLCLAFAEIDSAIDALSISDTDTREIRMLVRAVRSNITERIITYSAKHPHIAFATSFDFNERDFEKYDIIIDRKCDAYPHMESFELCSMRLRLKAAAGHPLARQKHTLYELCNQKFISWGEQSNMHRILLDACHRAGFSPTIAVTTNDKACYDRLVAAGVGIGIAREDSGASDTAYLDITDFNERYTVHAYYKSHAYYGNVKHFIDFLKSEN